MSRSVFANTIGAFVLESDNTPKPIIRQNGFGDIVKASVDAAAQEGKNQIVQVVEDEFGSAAGQVAGQAVDAGLDKAGIGTSNDVLVVQPQQSSTTFGQRPIPSFMLKTPTITAQQLQAGATAVSSAQQREHQRRLEIARAAMNIANRGLLEDQSQVTSGEGSATETPKKPKKSFFKTGAGIATILVGAAAITGGIVYFAKK